MWILKLKLKHDCIVGNRCKKFSCETYSLPLTQWTEGMYEYVVGQHVLIGEQENIDLFIQELKKDPSTFKLERKGNVIYLLEGHKGLKIPARIYSPKIFFIKPVFIDKKSYEHWEIAAFDKETLMGYIKELKEEKAIKFHVEKIVKSTIDSVFVANIMPLLTTKQKRAFELALEEGYYDFPRKIDLKKLAKMGKVSLSTIREHLRKAEAKILPSLK